MSSKNKIWHQALLFLEREHASFMHLRQALIEQSVALKHVDLELLDERQRQLEHAIAETENTVYQRVKWLRETLPNQTNFTWPSFWQDAPHHLDDSHQAKVEELGRLGSEIKQRVAENQRYAAAAQELLVSLKQVQSRITNEKTDLYTSRGTLSNQVAMQGTVGGVR
jgi:hypothetical protein